MQEKLTLFQEAFHANHFHRQENNKAQKTHAIYGMKCAEQIRDFKDFPTQSPFCSRDDGLSCRLDGITVQKLRKESIKAYGNAICVPVAVRIFDTINKYENICS
jgi:DNA (cytosine-5)-methyltransferase 1